MATGTIHDSPGSATKSATLVAYDQYVDAQISKTRRHVRGVDSATSLLTLAAGSVAYFLILAVVDHWAIQGGLGFWGRLLGLAAFLGGAGCYVARSVAPLLLRRINPVYAAQTIERCKPSLKNSLINFLLLRPNRAALPASVYDAVEQQAATRLADARVDAAVDRSKLIVIGYVFVALLAIAALYKIISPKDPLATVGRVAMPWANIGAPTRVAIGDVRPGDTTEYRGRPIAVSAEVRGPLGDGEVKLLYSTADGQIVDRQIVMRQPSDSIRFTCTLPEGSGGVQQDLEYRIVAGDAATRSFRVSVMSAPTIVVRSVDYVYPPYTGFPKQRVENQGDLKAIEGTEVTIRALANQPIHEAWIDLDCNGKPDRPMTANGDEATATLTLALAEDRRTPEHASYQVLFTTRDGRKNSEPTHYKIEVTPDVAPEVELLAPKRDDVQLPLGRSLTWEVAATDPDFALRQVSLRATAPGRQNLVEKSFLGEPWRGQLVRKLRFDPKQLGLKEGDVVEYWAEAVDVKSPNANRAQTTRRKITIVSPQKATDQKDQQGEGDQNDEQQPRDGDNGQQKQDRQRPGDDQKPQDDRQGDDKAEPNKGGDQRDEGQQGRHEPGDKADNQRDAGNPDDKQQPGDEKQSGDQKQPGAGKPGADKPGDGKPGDGAKPGEKGEPGDKQSDSPVPNDGSDDGSAIERVLQHRREQQQREGKPGDEPKADAQPDPKQQAGDQAKPQPDKQPGEHENHPDKQQPDKQQPDNGEQTRDDKAGKGPKGAQPKPGDDKGGANDSQPTDETPDGPKQPKPGDTGQQGTRSAEKPEGQQPPEKGSDTGAKGEPGKPMQDRQPMDKPEGTGALQDDKATGKPSADKPQDKQPGNDDHAGQSNDKAAGKGAQSKGTSGTERKQEAAKDKQRPDAKGGDLQQEKGPSGAGDQGKNDKGSPSPQDKNSPRDKNQQTPNRRDTKPENTPNSPSKSKHESDSKGGQEGDESGGGREGGGQKANRPGTGSAGKNTAADQGTGSANEPGKGEDSQRPGGDKSTDQNTGKQGAEKGGAGNDRSQPPGEKGNPNDGAHGKPAGGPQDKQPPADKPADKPGDATGEPGGQPAPGGGGATQPDGVDPPPAPSIQTKPDDPNLDYARKATQLAIEHLKDQLKKEKPDQELLDKLGWSKPDLEEFIRRWESRQKGASAGDDAAARRQFDDALRSLGLVPRSSTTKANASRDDKQRGVKESRRTAPPAEYAEQYRAYTEGTARGGK